MASLDGKVALISGVARGMGRTHAVELARAGASIVGFDLGAPLETVTYTGPTSADLETTASEVEALGQEILALTADVRVRSDVDKVVAEAIERFGRIDIVVANAGIIGNGESRSVTDDQWNAIIDTNLTGAWYTIQSALPAMIDAGRGGSIVIIGSGAIGFPRVAAYSAAKAGCVGLMKSLAAELAEYKIRVNLIHPTMVGTPMILNEASFHRWRPDLESPTVDDVREIMSRVNSLDVPFVEPEDISRAVGWLVSDDARYVTGVELQVDAGSSLHH
jgi:SDR family mycofactocin-dependent oxidoreductase